MKYIFTYSEPFIFESGESISNLNIAYHTYGQLNADKDNVVWVFHALTGDSDVATWWSSIFGKGNILDPAKHFIICANVIGSPYGSSCPTDLSFPKYTIRDICRGHELLADHLELIKIHLCIGGSFGGDQALEFAYSFNGRIDHLVLIASCARESAWAIAVHETQRLAMQSDPTFGELNGGQDGIKAARAIGMLTYRTAESFITRQTDTEEKLDNYLASSYIQYQGNKFADRFSAVAYYYLTKCLDSHDVGRGRGGLKSALSKLHIPTLIVSINSDMLIPPSLQREIYDHLPYSEFQEINSEIGHDGFLTEADQLKECILPFIQKRRLKYSIHKFGGKSLANGQPLKDCIDIIEAYRNEGHMMIVLSARGETTNHLLELYEMAVTGENYTPKLETLIAYQYNKTDADIDTLVSELENLLSAVSILKIRNQSIENKIIAYGELLSAEVVQYELRKKGIASFVIDARHFMKTKEKYSETVDLDLSRSLFLNILKDIDPQSIPIITGFISSNETGETTNLGRNGSNYTASLVASFVKANCLYNWTDVDGIYSTNPKIVLNAKLISHLTFREAYELANSGTNVLHTKTILPLMSSNIPLIIKSSQNPTAAGTRIDQQGSGKGIKAVSAIGEVSLIAIEGSGLTGTVGIDARIFTCLSREGSNIRLISQASTERGIGFIIQTKTADSSLQTLNREFQTEISSGAINSIEANHDVAIIAITGRHNYALEKAIHGLRKHKIWIHLFSNSINGENISLVIDKQHTTQALNIIHDFVI